MYLTGQRLIFIIYVAAKGAQLLLRALCVLYSVSHQSS